MNRIQYLQSEKVGMKMTYIISLGQQSQLKLLKYL